MVDCHGYSDEDDDDGDDSHIKDDGADAADDRVDEGNAR